MLKFEFATAGRIFFGAGSARELRGVLDGLGRRAFLVTGRSQERCAPVLESLAASGLEYAAFALEGEPAIDIIRQAVEIARDERCDCVISCGGGSVIDGGKAIAALLANTGDLLDFMEVVGRGQPLRRPSVPFVAIPTTAGTGSEVTRNAVLASPEHKVKASLRSPWMLPAVAVIDPELTLEMPPDVTASTGLDALTQLIEPYVSSRANAMTDMFCLEGIRRVARSLSEAYANGANLEARTDMAFASLLGGLSLANAGLGVVHGFAAPVGGMFLAPHGAVCAALLPYVMEMNIHALRARAPESEALERYRVIARELTGNPAANPEDSVRSVRDLCRNLKIPGLGSYGVRPEDVPALVERASNTSSMKGNPITLTAEELARVLEAAL